MPAQRRRRNPQPLDQESAVPVDLPEDQALPILQSAEVIGGNRIPWGSNYTFLVGLDAGPDRYLRAIYKPRDGERPLHDFPRGSLYKREYAAYLLGRSIGWPNVPLTLIRVGPYGIGSMQLYVDFDPEVTYFELIDDRADEFQRFAVFDLLANNADRKAGHCLMNADGRLWSIDHGLTFNASFKLRTVMVEFWGQPISDPIVSDLESLLLRLESGQEPAPELQELLAENEMAALLARLRAILEKRALPRLDPYLNVPWPWV